MRRILAGLFLALLFVGFLWSQKPSERRYLLVYTVMVLDPHRQHLMICNTPGCNDVYNSEERHEWFDSTEAALNWINTRETSNSIWADDNGLWKTAPSVSGFVGLYEIRSLPVVRAIVGKQKKLVTETHEREVDRLEWQLVQ